MCGTPVMNSDSLRKCCIGNSTGLQFDRSDARFGAVVRRFGAGGAEKLAVVTRPEVSSSSVARNREEFIRVRFGSGSGGAGGTLVRGGTVVGDGSVSGNSWGVPRGAGGNGMDGGSDGGDCSVGDGGIDGTAGTVV